MIQWVTYIATYWQWCFILEEMDVFEQNIWVNDSVIHFGMNDSTSRLLPLLA